MINKLFIVIFFSFIFSVNSAPIILVHGFMGWGPEELGDFKYWGGKVDLEMYLTELGYEVYTVSIGPISSDWDRAVEVFYQIKGGQVDYGQAHSAEYGLIQKPEGKFYDGFYPEWSETHPVHIIGHSQGGQTARMLEYLLKLKNENESSNLLSINHTNWIKSVTAISSPLNGTTLAPLITKTFPFVTKLLKWVGVLTEDRLIENDFDLEQWGFAQKENESISDYHNRLSEIKIGDSKNSAAWDLSLMGADEFNLKYNTDIGTYYFTFPTFSTVEETNYQHVPDKKMSWNLRLTSYFMGRFSNENAEWNENDGIVNTASMYAPLTEPSTVFNGISQKGIWQTIEKVHLDHHQILGRSASDEQINLMLEKFTTHCKLLWSLD